MQVTKFGRVPYVPLDRIVDEGYHGGRTSPSHKHDHQPRFREDDQTICTSHNVRVSACGMGMAVGCVYYSVAYIITFWGTNLNVKQCGNTSLTLPRPSISEEWPHHSHVAAPQPSTVPSIVARSVEEQLSCRPVSALRES